MSISIIRFDYCKEEDSNSKEQDVPKKTQYTVSGHKICLVKVVKTYFFKVVS